MSVSQRPFSQACENNKRPILEQLQTQFRECHSILEIGSGTGQHAAFFAAHMPHLRWQCSDRIEHLNGIARWLEEVPHPVPEPMELDVLQQDHWPDIHVDGAFSANTLHIMSWPAVCAFFAGLGKLLTPGASLVVYGPFRHDQQYTSASNAEFDNFLRARDPQSGIRDIADLNEQASLSGFDWERAARLPANNEIQVWRKR